MKGLWALLWGFAALPALGFELDLPKSARQTAERNSTFDRYLAPVGVYHDGAVPHLAFEGPVNRAAYRIGTAGLTPLQVMRPLREQIEAAGYRVLLDCGAAECGGFDFRYEIEVLPGPNMYVDLRAFHVLTAVSGPEDAPGSVITVLTSTAASSAYAQVITVGDKPPAVRAVSAVQRAVPTIANFRSQLEDTGHISLIGLSFETGSAKLSAGPFEALEELASFLSARPTVRVALVGHTDSVGSLESNIGLSRARAQAVRDYMVATHGVSVSRIEAEGMGYLAPVASNLTKVGREANRRVEVILLSE